MGTIAAAAGLFAGTDIDDVMLAVLFLSGRATGAPEPWQVWTGQAAGFTVLVAICVIAALGLTIFPGKWVGPLGLIPLALANRDLIRRGGSGCATCSSRACTVRTFVESRHRRGLLVGVRVVRHIVACPVGGAG